ncbi:MAG: hypothetical protein SCALA702_29870 [Melioribacteraceae bacterium]|nr:MAG: hypothetical protein SCALA702_29870 [Melioribacteraceae bacterium]
MRKISDKLGVLVLFLAVTNSIFSQSVMEKLTDDAIIFGEDFYTFFTAPARFDGTDWLYTAGLAAGTLLMFQADQTIQDNLAFQGRRTLNNDFWDIPTVYGLVQYGNIAALGGYGIGLATGNDELRAASRVLFESLSYSGLTVMAVRILAGRHRPYLNNGPHEFVGYTLDDDMQSFPSGHTTVAFAISTAMAEYFDNNWVRIPLYTLAGMTGYARIRNNMHWFGDVVIGAMIGVAGGLHVVHNERERQSGKATPSKLSIFPSFNGVNLVYRLN